ncbi:MAG: hypothetical protein HJJLKODD_01722 [Phycisphaerae bacterium]|nr:hypothetical protein [Phycisphaerae bacterium]
MVVYHHDRYSRQIRLAQVGEAGQKKLRSAGVVVVGCGALGSVLSDLLVRAGVGRLRIIDRDFVELSNLQRQVLFDEVDVQQRLPKSEAAVRKLNHINTEVQLDAVVDDLNRGNVHALLHGYDLIADGTDNFETRFLLNEASHQLNTPWVYAACVGTTGVVMPIIPHHSACLRCILDQPPPPDINPTCETAGVLGSVVHLAAAVQFTEILKMLLGHHAEITPGLISIDGWRNRVVRVVVEGPCRCFESQNYPYLKGQSGQQAIVMCGRNAVQIIPSSTRLIPLEEMADKLLATGAMLPIRNEFLIQMHINEYTLTLFSTGRAIIQGTADLATARRLYAQYIGN